MLCLNGQEERDEEFNLSVYSSEDCSLAPSLDLFAELPHKAVQHGEWRDGQSGGNISEVAFNKNPSYLLQVPSNCRLIVQIASEGRSPLGLYLIALSEAKSLSEISQLELESAVSTGSFLVGSNSLFCESSLEEQLLLVVPCTYSSKTVAASDPGSLVRAGRDLEQAGAAVSLRTAAVRQEAHVQSAADAEPRSPAAGRQVPLRVASSDQALAAGCS